MIQIWLEKHFIPFALTAFVFFLPFTFFPTIEVGFTIKISEIIALLIFITLFCLKLTKRDFRWRFTSLDLPLFGFLFVALISLSQGINLERGLAIYMWTVFSVLAIFYMLINVVKDENLFKRLIVALLIASFLASLLAFYQFFGDFLGWATGLKIPYKHTVLGYPRPHSTLLEPLYFGNFLLISLPVSFLLLINRTTILSRRFLYLISSVNLAALFLTLSRGAWIGMIVAIIISVFGLSIWVYTKSLKKEGLIRKYFLSLLLIFLISFALVYSSLELGPRLSGVDTRPAILKNRATVSDYSVDRAETAAQAWNLFKSHPILGIGIGNFGPTLENAKTGISGFKIVNNLPLELLAELGIFGLFFYIWFLGCLFYKGVSTFFKLSKDKIFWVCVIISLTATLVGGLIQQLTFSTLNISYFWFLLAFYYIASELAMKEEKNENSN